MKKLTMLLASLLLFCGCSEKKNDGDISDDITDDIPEVTTEAETESERETAPEIPDTGNISAQTGFRTYKDEDFKTVNVALSYPDKIPPVNVTSFIIPENDYGARLSPCKSSEDPSEYLFIADSPYYKDNGFLETPEKGVASKAFLCGDKIYLLVNYDNLCLDGHEWAIYSYDTLKTKFDEIYSYSELSDCTLNLYNSFIVGNKFMFEIGYSDNSNILRSVDLESGKEEDIYNSEEPMAVYSNGSNKLLFFIEGNDVVLKEFDIETGEERVIAQGEDFEDESISSAEMSTIPAYTCRNPHKEGIRLTTEDYTIETGILGAEIVYASETRFIARQSMGRNEIHTYDLEKMEHYVTRLNGNDSLAVSFDGNVVLYELGENGYSGDLYYVIPELGVAYMLAEDTLVYLHRNGNSIDYYTLGREKIQFADEGYFNAYKAEDVGSISGKE